MHPRVSLGLELGSMPQLGGICDLCLSLVILLMRMRVVGESVLVKEKDVGLMPTGLLCCRLAYILPLSP